jgi:hypothetical protein
MQKRNNIETIACGSRDLIPSNPPPKVSRESTIWEYPPARTNNKNPAVAKADIMNHLFLKMPSFLTGRF